MVKNVKSFTGVTWGKQNGVEITMYKRYFSCFWVFVSTNVYNSLKVGMGLCYRFFVFNKNDIITKVLCLGFHRTRWRKNPHFLSLLIRFTSCCCKQLVCSQPDIIFHHINTLLFLGVWGVLVFKLQSRGIIYLSLSLDYVSKFKLFMSNINISWLKAQHHLAKFIAVNLYLHLYCYQSFTPTPPRLDSSPFIQVH